MKKYNVLFILIFLISLATTYAQVAVNTDGSSANTSAMLDVKSTTKGMLIPRMTASQRDAITTPATGLMVYITDDSTFFQYNGSGWEKISHWTYSANTLYTDTTLSVGIGITSPTGKFEVATINHSGTYSSDVCTGGTVTALENYPGQAPANAFDDNTITYWSNNNNLPAWLQYDLGSGVQKRVAKYRLYYDASVSTDNSPDSWNFMASNDGTTWATIDAQTGQGWTATGWKDYTFSNTTNYRYYRIDVTDNKGTANNFVSIYEMEMMEETLTNDPTFIVTGNKVGIGTATPAQTLDLNGSFRYTDGNQSSGKILSSDAGGNVSWVDGTTVSGGGWTVASGNVSNTSANIGIGTSSPGSKLSVYNSTTDTSLNIINTNSNSSSHYGSFTELSGTGTGMQYGSYQSISNTGASSHYGSFTELSGTGSGTQYGSYQSISNTGVSYHYGSYNVLSGTGTGLQYGSYQSISNTGYTNHFGSVNVLSGIGTGPQYGSYQSISNTGAATHYGSYNSLLGTGTGTQYGSYQSISNTGSSHHYGAYNSLLGTGAGEQYGSYQSISNTGSSYHYGSYNYLHGIGTGQQYGSYQNISNTGSSSHYGAYNLLSGVGTGTQYGSYILITNTGAASHYGIKCSLSGTGTGIQYGSYQYISNIGSSNHFGTFSILAGTGTGEQLGSYQEITNTGSSNHYGTYNYLHGTGTGVQYGSYQYISNSGNGTHYGSNFTLNGTGSGSKYGAYSYIPSSAGGTHYGFYSYVLGTSNYAGYFVGRGYFSDKVGIGTTAPAQLLQVGISGDGTVALANSWTTFSDRRLKKNIVIIDNPLLKLNKITGYYYYWKTGLDTTRQIGVIAQEVQKVLPEIVNETDNGILTIDYSKLTPLLIEALKQQNTKIVTLENENKLLNERLNKLEKVTDKLLSAASK